MRAIGAITLLTWLAAIGGCGPASHFRDAEAGMDAGQDAGRDAAMDVGGGETGVIVPSGRCTPPGGACDFLDQGCPEGEACIGRVAGESSSCVPAGEGLEGAPCDPSASGECAAGLDCDLDGHCRQLCCPEAGVYDCEVFGRVCIGFSGGFGICTAEDACSPIYDPAEPTCPDGQSCLPMADGSTRCFDLSDRRAPGEACVLATECEPGAGCITDGSGTGGVCRRFCDRASSEPCGTDERCVPFSSGDSTFGVCVPG